MFDFSDFRYSRWDGSQQLAPFSADELMDALADELLDKGDVERALQRLYRSGDQGRLNNALPGLRSLMERLRAERQRTLAQHNLNAVIDDIKQQLDRVVQHERDGIAQRVNDATPSTSDQTGAPDDNTSGGDGSESQDTNSALRQMLNAIAQRKNQFLDTLPRDVPGQIKALSEYEFMDSQARQEFADLMQMLQQQVMQSYFQGMQQNMQSMTPEAMARTRDMVRDLNHMLEERARGGSPNFEEFMQKHGDFFPPGINTLDDLIAHMAERMAQMESMMASMSADQRQQLQEMMEQMLGDDKLRVDLARLGANLSKFINFEEMARPYSFSGDDPLSMVEAMAQMERLQRLGQMEEQMQAALHGDPLDGIDAEQLGSLLGPDAQHDVETLQNLAKMLEDAGYIKKQEGADAYEVTPHGVRKIGQKALRDIFSHLKKDGFGRHNLEQRGRGGERIDESKAYEFGDPFLLDIGRTLMRSVERDGRQTPVHLQPSDFEVYRTEMQTQSATVLLLDMSSSMFSNDCFAAAKKVAIALNSLIRSQYPRDILHIVGFNMVAREIKVDDLPGIDWQYGSQGTNLHHGLMLARRLLARSRCQNKQVIVITDGEPTAHLESNGMPYFDYPPTSRTIRETLREVGLCTKDGVVINTFMLEMRPDLVAFVNQMAKINKGRAFFSAPDQLGQYILVDYMANKRKKVS